MKQYRITDWGTIYDVESTEEEDLEFGVNLVKYADHLEAVSAARADALRWVLGRLRRIDVIDTEMWIINTIDELIKEELNQ